MRLASTFLGTLCLLFLTNLLGAATRVVVSVPPYEALVEAILPDAEVQVLLPPGQSCETYQPKPSQLQGLAKAQVVLLTGVDYERPWRGRLRQLAPAAIIVDLAEEDDHAEHAHAGHHEHAAHPWMSPHAVLEQVDLIEAGIKQLKGVDVDDVAERADALRARLSELDRQVGHLLEPYQGRLMLSYHPAYGALAERYHFETLSIETGASMPSPMQLRDIIQQAEEAGVQTVYVQPQDPEAAAERVAQALDAQVVELDPLDPDYFANVLAIAEQLATNWKAEHAAQ